MREIKFRAWDIQNNKMRLWEDDGILSGDDSDMSPLEHIKYGFEYGERKGLVFMQFTGLKDKNGKEIYEGDIVINGKRKQEFTGAKYGRIGFGKGFFYHFVRGWGRNSKITSAIEVIGNIYENPEMLKWIS